MKTKYQTIAINKPANTPAGRYTDSQELDSDWDFCDGVQIIESTDGGIPFYSVGLEDKSQTYHNITHKKDWMSGNDTPINQRYKDIYIPVIRGEKLDIKTEFGAVLASDINYQIIFRLHKK